jgi:hypothetical protein
MYEMLTGKLPFDAATHMALLLKHVSERPRPPSELVSTIDPALESIVLWTMEKQPERRCPSARELRRALKEYLAGASALRTQNLPVSGSQPLLTMDAGPASKDIGLRVDAVDRRADPLSPPSAEVLPIEAILGPAALTSDLVPPSAPSVDPRARVLHDDAQLEALIAESLDIAQESVSNAPTPLRSVGDEPDPEVDYRRHAAALAERAQYMWHHYGIMFEPYRGSHPFWVLDHNNNALGPLVHSDAMKVLRSEGEAGYGPQACISVDGRSWIPATDFVRLSGQEALLHRPQTENKRSQRSLSGKLENSTLASLFARVAKDGPTGRLLFTIDDGGDTTHAELHVVCGKPTFVFVTNLSLQLPQILVQKKLIEENMIPKLLHRVVSDEVPLEDIVERETLLDVRSYRAAFMKERLFYIFCQKRCAHTLDTEVLPASAKPFSPSLLALLPEFVYRRLSGNELRHIVWQKAELRLQRSERFNAAIAEMGLTDGQLQIVRKLAKGPTLAEPLRKCEVKEEKLYLAMAYILMESDLLLRPI